MERKFIFNLLALLCGIWFVLLGWAWVYWFNVVFVFPVGIIGVVLWQKGRHSEHYVLNRIAGGLLILGLLSSLGTLLIYR
jgi:hypothetical protein